METDFEYDTRTILVLPHLSLGFFECESCGAESFGITLGWIFWSVVFFFPACDD